MIIPRGFWAGPGCSERPGVCVPDLIGDGSTVGQVLMVLVFIGFGVALVVWVMTRGR